MTRSDTHLAPNGDGSGPAIGNGHATANGHATGAGLVPVANGAFGRAAPGPVNAGSASTPTDPLAAASIDAPPVQVAPGEVTHTTLSVTNLRSEPASFALSISGLERGWYTLTERIGPLEPGERVDVPLDVNLPRAYPPCSLLVSVEARLLPADASARPAQGALPGRDARSRIAANGRNGRSGDDPRRTAGRHDVHVLVGDGATVSARLEPPDVVGGRRGRFTVVLRNRGGQSQQVRLHGVAPDPFVSIRFDPGAPLLLPGHQVEVAARVRAHRPVFREANRRPFAVQVQGRGTPTMADGSFTSRPWLPRWASKSLVILIVLALWAAVAVVGIRALSSRLHKSAVQSSQVSSPSATAKGSKGKAKTSNAPHTGTTPPSSSGTGGSSAGKHPAATGPSSKRSAAPTVEVTGTVTGSSPGGVTVKLAPTSLVSPQVLGATSASTGTLASSVRRAGRKGGGADVPYGSTAVLTSAVRHRHRPGSRDHDAAAGSSSTLVSASGKSRLPDGKVYGTEAAAAFFPGLAAAAFPTLTTTTAPDGRFVFTGVPAPGTYLLTFTSPGFNSRKYVVQTAEGANLTLDTALSPGTGTLSGEVRGPKGPLGGVSITVSDGSVTITTVTPTTGSGVGTWSVSGLNTPDTYLVSASDPGYGTQTTTASLAASASLAGVDLKLKPGVGSIDGTVTNASSGQPLGGVAVTATNGTATVTATTSTVSPVGTYSLPDLAIPDTWTLSVSGQGWIAQTQLVKLDGNVRVNASLTTSGANVVGVVSSAHHGLANVGLTLQSAQTTFKTLSESVSPAGGFDFGQIPPGQYVLSATKFGYTTQSASVNVSAGQTVTVDLTLPSEGQSTVKAGTITGTVVNEFTGAALAGIDIELDGNATGAVTNSDGVYTVTAVSPGLHEITAVGTPEGFADSGVQVDVAEGVTVTAPIIPLPSLATLSGIVLSAATGDPIPTPKVEILQGSTPLGTPVKSSSTSSGTYSITDIPAGNYVLQVSATGYDTSETAVSISPGEALTENVSLTEGPSYQVKTYFETTNGTLQPQKGVCVVVSRTAAGTLETPVAKLSTGTGGPVGFSALISGDTYVAAFELPDSTLSTAKACTSLSGSEIRASAPKDIFVARPDNTAIYPAVLALEHGVLAVELQFPYVVAASGGTGTGITQDCPVEASTATSPPCPKVASSTTTLPEVSVTGTSGYATQTNGTPGTPETATVDLVPPEPGSNLWTYPTAAKVPTFVSTQVTLIVSDAAGQFETLKKTISLPAAGTSPTLDEYLTPVPVPVSGSIVPTSGVSLTVSPDVLSPTTASGTTNNLTSTDDIGAVEGAAGALKWSDPATGASGGSAQPGTYALTLSEAGYVTLTKRTVEIPLCAPKPASCGTTLPTLTLEQQVTLEVGVSSVPGTSLPLPKVSLYLAGTFEYTEPLVDTGATYVAKFTDKLTPTATGSYTFTVSGPGIRTYTSTALTLGAADHGLLRETPPIVEDGWLKGTVSGLLVPTNAGSSGATEPLTGATVTATSGASCSTPATFSATATGGTFLLVGDTGGLLATESYLICVSASGFTSTSSTLVATAGKNTATFTLTATKITQQIAVSGVGTGVIVTVTATSPIGPTILCTITVGSATPTTCSTASAAMTGTTTVFTLQLDPTTYSFTLAAPLYEEITLGPIPYAPGEHPLEKTYTLTQQFLTVSGKVTASSTGRKSTHAIHALPLTLTSSTGKTYTTTTTSKGTYTFSTKVPVGSYTITVGDTYTTIAPISFSTGTTNRFVENFAVYAPPIPVKLEITNSIAAASANGVTVTLTPPSNAAAATKHCDANDTHELLEEGLGSPETTIAVGTATQATASFTSLVPDVYTVTFSDIGTKTDRPTPRSHTLVVCPSTASSPATTQTPTTPPTFTLSVGEISVTVTLETAPPTPPAVKMTAGSLKAMCTPVAGSSTTASCELHMLVDLTQTYTVTISALGYTTPPSQNVTLTPTSATKTLTAVTLSPKGLSPVKVTLTATGHGAVAAAVATAAVTLEGAHTYTATTSPSGVATFSGPVKPGSYKLVLTPNLSGASSKETEGTVRIKTTTKSYSVKVKTHTVSGTVTLAVTPAPTSPVTVHIAVDGASCGTVTITGKKTGTYTCVLPPGTYTLTFSATGYTSTTVSATVKAADATGKDVSLQPAPVPSVTVALAATGHDAVAAAIATATVTLTGGQTYHEVASSSGVATFSAVSPGTYTVSFAPNPKLSGASSPQTEGAVIISSTATTFTEKVKTGAVSGTITLGGTPPTSTVTVAVSIGTVSCTTATVATGTSTARYTCALPPGTYTVTFTAAGYKTDTVSGVGVTATHPTIEAATLAPTP